ncbi:sulfite exporter TauE/SafE family protein [Paenibacillus chibensis]|uniref:sulfite exporter TauE/SafE family protein n=1 Tax=Paenibacillus chibensis TaxID=59846 RepID=UPI000FDC978C|nr:sulfite exporter TauE/SafE family protein [Paenibacillus chibensis]MEC0368634.1 sulfite exporter TauE/SafE family protein [Paenibacillus chibensis]
MDSAFFLIVCIIVVVAAGFTQGLTSFGFALIAMPFLAKVIPLQQAVPIVVILSLCTNLMVIVDARRHVDLKKIWILILSSLAAAPLGTSLLLLLDERLLKAFAGVFIILVALLQLLGKSFPVKREKLAFVPVGILSGLLNGSISMSGPPVALFLSNQRVGKDTFRANITAYGIILNVITICTYAYSGMLIKPVFTYSLWLVPSMLIGVFIGIKAIRRLNDQWFRRIALWVIMLSGLWTVISSL